MKNKKVKYLAMLLAFSMAVSPMSYTKAYAENAETAQAAGAVNAGENLADGAGIQEGTDTSGGTNTSDGSQSADADHTGNGSKENGSENAGSENTGSQDQNTPSQDSGSTGENSGEDQNTSDETGEGKDSEKMNEKSDDPSDKADAEKKDAEEKSSEETAKQADETTAKETLVTPTKEITGVEVLKNDGTSYGMFPITDATCTVKGDKIEISFSTGTKTVFDRLYLGAATDEDKSNYVQGTNTGSTCQFTIQVPISAKNSWIPVSVGRSDKGTWSENLLWMSIPDVQTSGEKEDYQANDGVTAIYGSDDAKKPGQAYSMIKIAASKVVVKGGALQVSVWIQPASSGSFTYDAIYIGNRNDETKEPIILGEVDTEKNLEKFTFTVPLEKAGGEVSFVPRNGRTQKWSTSSSLAFKLPAMDDFVKPSEINITTQPKQETEAGSGSSVALSVEASGEEGINLNYQWQFSADGATWADCTGVTAKTATYTFTMSLETAGKYRCIVSDATGTSVTSSEAVVKLPEAPVVTGNQVKVVKSNGADFAMFKTSESKVVQDGEELEITLSTKNVSFDKIYFGYKDDELKESVANGTEANGEWSFTFHLPASAKGTTIPVTLGKPDGSWYSNQYLWMYIPDEGITELPSAADAVKVIAGGTGAAYNDFNIVSSKAVLKGKNVILTLNVKGQKWTRLYQGVQADADKTSAVNGVYRAEDDTTTFTLTVPAEKQGMNIAVTPGTASAWMSWARDLYINVPNLEGKANVTENGVYDLYGSAYPTSSYASLNFERGSSISINGDTATVTMVTQASAYDKLYLGTVSDADSVKDAGAISAEDKSEIASGYKTFTFTIPTKDLGKEINYVVHIQKSNKWAEKQSTFYINGILPKTGELPTPDPDPTPDPEPGTKVPADGIYSIQVDSSASMFRVIGCELTVKNGKMKAVLTLSGTGYGYLYVGTKEQAAAADKSSWIPFQTKMTENGEKYTYEIPVESLDKKIAVAAYSIKNKIWYDRMLTFKSDTLVKTGDIGKDDQGNDSKPSNPTKPTTPSTKPSNGSNGKNDGKADHESKYEADTSGSTGRVDSTTALKDGVYTPDRFTWSGGTGKVRITCNKVTIKNGQAYATLVFSSDHYQYVKANGNTYYTTKSGGTATVVIPIALNKNNKILGMTDKMSVAHEIEYSIFVYLAAAGNGTTVGENSNKTLDEKAPEIMGLEYQSETELEYAEYFKIYHYDQGIVLLEVDMTKDTARDPEKTSKETSEDTEKEVSKSDKKDSTENKSSKSDAAEEESGDSTSDQNGVSEEELAAELYKGNVVKYLLVPEDVEVPVGLDQDMIIVKMPADKTYVASDEILEQMKELDLLDSVAAVGMEQKACTVPEIAEKMQVNEDEDEADAEVIYGGSFEKPELKALVKKEVSLALLPGELLPKDAEKDSTKIEDKKTKKQSTDDPDELTVEEQTERMEEITEKFALLGIPMIIDRSADEKTELAQYEWIKVYGVLFGCEEKMDKMFEEAVDEAGVQENQ